MRDCWPVEGIPRESLGDEVTRRLRAAILAGHYQPGDHLVEAEIARAFGVSHGPVREALRELEAEELVVIRAHRGAYVRAFTAADLREIYSLRSILETAMVRLVVETVTADLLADLDGLIEAMRRAADSADIPRLIELDLAFHRRLADGAGHRRLAEAWGRLVSPTRLFLTMAIPQYLAPRDAAESHPPIVEALRRRDRDALITHMERGVLAVGERIAAAMGSATVRVPPPHAAATESVVEEAHVWPSSRRARPASSSTHRSA